MTPPGVARELGFRIGAVVDDQVGPFDQAENIQRAWAIKGENMIILSDNCMNKNLFPGPTQEGHKKTQLLVLRLDGKVEKISIDSHMYSNLAPNY